MLIYLYFFKSVSLDFMESKKNFMKLLCDKRLLSSVNELKLENISVAEESKGYNSFKTRLKNN